jgi:hypothetical protein
MVHGRSFLLVAFSSLPALSACSSSKICAGIGEYAVTVEIRDSVTGFPAAYRARLVIRSGTYVDGMTDTTPPSDSATALVLGAGTDRPGTYEVTVSKSGYATWTRTVVVAPGEGCDEVKGVLLHVLLQPLPPGS